MNVELRRASMDDAKLLWEKQVLSFQELLKRYQDFETSPGAEPPEKTILRLSQPFTYFYWIEADGETAGAIRVVDAGDGSPKRISPIFVLPDFRGRGIAQTAIREAERLHGSENWELDTILQEKGNCHLYEKMGYRATGETKVVNERMTLVFYRK